MSNIISLRGMFPQCRKMRDLAGAGTFPLLFQRRIKHLVKGSAAGERDEELRGLNHAPYRKRGMMDVESLPPHPVGRRTLFFFLTAGRDRPLNCPAFTGAKAGTRRSGGCRHGPLDDGLPRMEFRNDGDVFEMFAGDQRTEHPDELVDRFGGIFLVIGNGGEQPFH